MCLVGASHADEIKGSRNGIYPKMRFEEGKHQRKATSSIRYEMFVPVKIV